jgi:putative membrane protein insertion efficiency factor
MSTVRLDVGPQASRPHSIDGAQKKCARTATEMIAFTLRNIFRLVVDLPARVLLLLIRLYQHTLSPVLPVLFGGACGCRFSPTCSHYAADAIRTHGVIAGVVLAAIRLIKCTPLHPGGFDPAPPPRRQPRCERVRA